MNLTACRSLTAGPLTGTWFRGLNPRYSASPLATAHTATVPGRYNGGTVAHPAFEVLYLAEDHVVALFEVQALLGSPLPPAVFLPNPHSSWTVINVQVQLSQVADLTDAAQRRLIDTTVQELTGDWRGYLLRPASRKLVAPYWTRIPTQRLGAALFRVPRLEGFITYSARVPTQKNLVVFPQKLQRGSSVNYSDAAGKTYSILPPTRRRP
jgi:RES domain-containing protein